jgi:ATP/maltotriose-dependent transcriptional regulator MalT
MLSVGGDIRFTERQRQVVQLIAAGCSNLEIAERLSVSPRTAKAHSDVLRVKLGVGRRRQIPAAYRAATGEDPLQSLEAGLGVRDDSRTPI